MIHELITKQFVYKILIFLLPLGVIDCQFHPHQPWVFSAGADKTIRLFT